MQRVVCRRRYHEGVLVFLKCGHYIMESALLVGRRVPEVPLDDALRVQDLCENTLLVHRIHEVEVPDGAGVAAFVRIWRHKYPLLGTLPRVPFFNFCDFGGVN